MLSTTYGDMATSFLSLRNNLRLKTDLARLSQELASGQTADLGAATGGDLGNYAGIENALSGLTAFRTSASEAALFTQNVQRSLESVQNTTSEIGPALLLAGSTQEATLIQSAAADARAGFSSVVSILNTRVADRAILAGTATGGTALANAEDMLTALQTAIAAETTAAGVESVVDAWFDDPGGGFETIGYLGNTTELAAFRIGPDEAADLSLRADDPRLREVLKGYAMAALVADDALSGSHPERVALIETAATRLLGADRALTELRAGVGTIEERIENAQARNGAEVSALEIARSDILRVDPYRTATDLKTVEAQLQTLYAITARLSRLSLAEYLR